jgi:hypothetical protein
MAEATRQAAAANLVPCPTCGRSFNADRIQVHARICQKTGGTPIKPRGPNSPRDASGGAGGGIGGGAGGAAKGPKITEIDDEVPGTSSSTQAAASSSHSMTKTQAPKTKSILKKTQEVRAVLGSDFRMVCSCTLTI